MKGKIIKGIAGFYYVHAGDALHSADGIYECKAKGVFRKDHRKPLVGDDVEMEVIDEAQKKGNTLYYADGKKMSSQKAYEYETLQRAKNVVSKITTSGMSKGKKFQTCFNWVIKHNYSTKRIFMNQTSWPALYANDYLVDSNTVGHGGNCFSDACAFAYLAKALGYKNVYVCVDTNKVGGSGHCWAEIGGLVYDPLFAEAKNYSKYFGATYRTYGLSAIRKVAI